MGPACSCAKSFRTILSRALRLALVALFGTLRHALSAAKRNIRATPHSTKPIIDMIKRTGPSRQLEVFDNPTPERDYTIRIRIPEFTCLCPKTGQPDFATLHIEYVPDQRCIELKALKRYIWSYRQEGSFHEAVTNHILDDLVRACMPRFMRLTAKFNVRGGIYTTVIAEHRAPTWTPHRPVVLP